MTNAVRKLSKKVEPATDIAGNPITDEMINQFEPMIIAIAKEFFGDGELNEAAMDFEDLKQHGRYHAQRCLRKFDPHEAIYGVTSDASKKRLSDEEHLAYKLANVETVLKKAREKWVRKTLYSEFRRLRWDYSFGERGGHSEPVDFGAVLTATAIEGQSHFCNGQKMPVFENINLVEGHQDRDKMFDIGLERGPAAAIEFINSLDPKRRENLLDYIQFTANSEGHPNIYHLEFKKAEIEE